MRIQIVIDALGMVTQKLEETCSYSDTRERPPTDAGVKNLQGEK